MKIMIETFVRKKKLFIKNQNSTQIDDNHGLMDKEDDDDDVDDGNIHRCSPVPFVYFLSHHQ